MNKLYFGDNLEVMREMEDGRVDLICTDPPFNSGRNYNAFLTESRAQTKAFTDTWTWDDPAQDARADIETRARTSDTYKALDTSLKGYDLVLQNAVSGNKGAMRAYLAFMGPRLAEMHRLLKNTGSIYLHCDPTASHYLKGVMDAIWDQGNRKKNEHFRNEIVWSYRTGGASKKEFSKKHDIILFYTKSKNFTFHQQKEKSYTKSKSRKPGVVNYGGGNAEFFEDEHGVFNYVNMRDIWEMSYVGSTSPERLGYPTQKPRALYERMIKASSNEGEIVMDPFAGCGTTLDAAQTLNRAWIGIDITILSLEPMARRLGDRHGLKPSIDYEIHGYPTNMQEVQKLVRDEKKYHDFSNWAVTRLGLQPTKSVGDGGKDGEAEVGHITLWDPGTGEKTNTRILAEVKSGKPTIAQVRAFCHTMSKHDAIGIFITIEPVSAGMRQEAADMGTFSHNNDIYPKLQFWQIDDDYFDDPGKLPVRLPEKWLEPTRKLERHFSSTQIDLNLHRGEHS